MTGRTVVIGESILDVVEARSGVRSEHAGGSPANVAVGLARLQQSTTFVTQLARDHGGRLILDHLSASGVRTIASPIARTPSAHATIQEDGAAEYEFDIAWTLEGDHHAEIDVASHVHTGSIASHIAPGADAVVALLARARRRATVSYDPNVRPSLAGAREQVVSRTEACIGLADVVKASDEDIAWLYPDRGLEDVLDHWAGLGASVCVATLGAEGSLARVAGETVRVEPLRVDLVDTVGAGDSFMSALIDGLLRARLLGMDARAALAQVDASHVAATVQRAARAAAITVSRAGANPPTARELGRVDAAGTVGG